MIRKNGIPVEFVNKSNFGKVVPYGSIFHGLSVPLPVHEQKYILTREQVGDTEQVETFEFKAIYSSLIEALIRGFSSYSKQMAQGAVNFNVSTGSVLERETFRYISPFGFVFKDTLNKILESPIVPDEILGEIDISFPYEINQILPVSSENPKRLQELLDKYDFNLKAVLFPESSMLENGYLQRALTNAVIFRALRKGNKDMSFDHGDGLRAICINNKKQIESIPITVNMIKKIIINEDFINDDYRGKEKWRNIIMPEIAILKQVFQ